MSDLIKRLNVLREFLGGAGPLDGFWFGDANPDQRGAFWWRRNLSVMAEAADQLADAHAAQAMVVERAADMIEDNVRHAKGLGREIWAMPDLRALADADGLALVQALRAERDELKQKLISPDPYEDTAHFDDHSVNRFAAVMKGKLASKRLQGRGGWQEPEVHNGYLSRLLREHVDKGDPVDVANFAMMIHQRGERIGPENEGATCGAIERAEAERDRLVAANSKLEAKVAGLREAVIRVKPLDWQEGRFCGQDMFYAETPSGTWMVVCYSGRGFRWAVCDSQGNDSDEDWSTPELAKAAAQGDYDAEVRAALATQEAGT